MTADQAISTFTEPDWVQAAAQEFFHPLPEVGSIYGSVESMRAARPPQERRRAAPQPAQAHHQKVA